MSEIYKVIDGFSNYEVSNLGNVRNKRTGRVLRQGEDKDGYLMVWLYKNGFPKMFKVHRLVAINFLENPDNKSDVNHINGVKTDNQVENLEWNTHSENMKHSYRNGLNFQTTKKRVRCIETDQIFESQCEAARYFKVHLNSICSSIHKGHKVLKKYHFELVE